MKKIGMLGGMSWTWSAEYHGLVNEEVSHRREFVAGTSRDGSDGTRARDLRRRTHPCRLDVFGKTEAAGQRGVGEEGDPVNLVAAQGEDHHAPGLRAHVVAEGRLAVGAGRA